MIYAVSLTINALAIAGEALWSRRRGLDVYRRDDTLSNLAAGAGQQVLTLFVVALLGGLYFAAFAAARHAWGDLWPALRPDRPLHWAIVFIVVDLVWYVSHRASHRVNFFAAAHAVHHQATDFNHVSSFRHSWTSRIVLFVFYLPLAVLGVPFGMLLLALYAVATVQFLSHNGVITRRLGWLEYVFITPRQHLVHHGREAPYLDRNFGGMFCVWDRLFGTYQDLLAAVPVKLGSVSTPPIRDAFAANWEPYRVLLRAQGKRPSWRGKLRVWIEPPEALGDAATTTATTSPRGRASAPALGALVLTTTTLACATFPSVGWGARLALSALAFACIAGLGRALVPAEPR